MDRLHSVGPKSREGRECCRFHAFDIGAYKIHSQEFLFYHEKEPTAADLEINSDSDTTSVLISLT